MRSPQIGSFTIVTATEGLSSPNRRGAAVDFLKQNFDGLQSMLASRQPLANLNLLFLLGRIIIPHLVAFLERGKSGSDSMFFPQFIEALSQLAESYPEAVGECRLGLENAIVKLPILANAQTGAEARCLGRIYGRSCPSAVVPFIERLEVGSLFEVTDSRTETYCRGKAAIAMAEAVGSEECVEMLMELSSNPFAIAETTPSLMRLGVVDVMKVLPSKSRTTLGFLFPLGPLQSLLHSPLEYATKFIEAGKEELMQLAKDGTSNPEVRGVAFATLARVFYDESLALLTGHILKQKKPKHYDFDLFFSYLIRAAFSSDGLLEEQVQKGNGRDLRSKQGIARFGEGTEGADGITFLGTTSSFGTQHLEIAKTVVEFSHEDTSFSAASLIWGLLGNGFVLKPQKSFQYLESSGQWVDDYGPEYRLYPVSTRGTTPEVLKGFGDLAEAFVIKNLEKGVSECREHAKHALGFLSKHRLWINMRNVLTHFLSTPSNQFVLIEIVEHCDEFYDEFSLSLDQGSVEVFKALVLSALPGKTACLDLIRGHGGLPLIGTLCNNLSNSEGVPIATLLFRSCPAVARHLYKVIATNPGRLESWIESGKLPTNAEYAAIGRFRKVIEGDG